MTRVRSFDPDLLFEVTKDHRDLVPENIVQGWVENHRNIMFEKDGSVGLAAFEYPGLYNVHWFFKIKGREAIKLAREMLKELFTEYGAEAVRGLTRVDIKAARWASRQVGLKSYGIMPFPNGDCELFCMTKDEFFEKENN